jgi:predicted dinucleotide-binding enzyme
VKIGVLGTGEVGRAIAGKLAALGHEVVFGSRTPTGQRVTALAASIGTKAVAYDEAVAYGEWIVNALPGEHALAILGGCAVAGKIFIDISNYTFAADQAIEMPIGEAIQRAFPEVRLVKTLNSVSAHLMVDPASLGACHSVFVAGNDAAAKAVVAGLLESFGWSSILDLGDLTACRAMEQLIPLWMRLEQLFGGPDFNLKVVSALKPPIL